MDLSIYLSILLLSCPWSIWTGCRRVYRAIQWALEDNHGVKSGIPLNAVNWRVSTGTLRWSSSELRDALWPDDCARFEIHCVAMLVHTGRPWRCQFRNKLGIDQSEGVNGKHVGCWDSPCWSFTMQPRQFCKVTLLLGSHEVVAGGWWSAQRHARSWNKI